MAQSGSTWSEVVAATVRAELARRRVRATALMDVIDRGRTATYERINGVVPFDTRELILVAEFLEMDVQDLVADADDRRR